MAFETGYAANEFELQQKLDAFITSNGWTKRASLGTFDSVYFSSGEDEYKDIYIRVAAGLVEEPMTYGKDQMDFGDGYTGYMNCFAYQWFPSDGTDGYDGYGEAGKFGPVLYWLNGGDEYDVYHEKFASKTGWSWINYLPNRARPGEPQDFHTYYYMTMDYSDAAFDGKRYFYYWSRDSSFARFDLAAERCELLDQKVEGGANGNTCGLSYYVDPVSRREYVWAYKEDRTGSIETIDGELNPTTDIFKRWDVTNAVMQYGFSKPEWGTDRQSGGGDMIWNGRNHLYVMRGSEEKEWAKYHIPSDTWTVLSAAEFPYNHRLNDTWIWLDKAHSGFGYSRIYLVLDNDPSNRLYYINMDENSGDPIGGWQSAGILGRPTQYRPIVFHNRRNRFYYWPGSGLNYRREIWWADFKESGSLTWNLASDTYLPTVGGDDNTAFYYVDGYASRLRTSLYDRTQYWFMCNKDRIIVLTYADDKYSYCYMGSFSQHAATTPHAKSTSDIHPGTNVLIPIDVLKGEFEVGQRMFIADVTDKGGMMYMKSESIENIHRKFKAMEMFEITDVDPGVSITADQLTGYYPAGSRIAYDPQPVGISLGGLDRIQMLNHINTYNEYGSTDMAISMAKLQTVSEVIVNSSGGDDRRGAYALWPINIVNSGTDGHQSGYEVRGNLIGAFAVSGTSGLSSGDTIAVGTNTYMVFGVDSGATFLYAFGPINEQ